MPARGSRCLSPLDCFTESDEYPYPSAKPYPQPFPFTASQEAASDDDEEEVEEDHEDKEWEECMERRRMMFAQMSRPGPNPCGEDDGEGAGRKFEGYTSISASLVAMLAQSGIGSGHLSQARDAATPVGTPVEIYEEPAVGMGPKVVRVEHRLRTSFAPGDILEEEEEGEEEDEEGGKEELAENQPSAEVMFAALRAFRMGPGRELRSGAEERDR